MANAKCNNCGSKLGCSCKKRTASDGKSCCAGCISGYERILKQSKPKSGTQPGVILSATATQKK